MERIAIGMAGIVLILGMAIAFSSNRRHIRLRVVGAAFALQVTIAVLALYVPAGKRAIAAMSGGVSNLLGYAQQGVNLIFGWVGPDIVDVLPSTYVVKLASLA